MKVLIKLGGTLLDDTASRARLGTEIAQARAGGHDVVVVHGGGKQMTRFLSERGVESRFVNGLRVSTPAVIDAVLKVVAGTVNHELLAALVAAGVNAVGLSGIDAALTEAEPIHAELGAVGRPARANTELLSLLCAHKYVPVIACVAVDRAGRIYNINADQMAVACALAFRADRLFFLTDVEGVRDASGRTAAHLTAADCERLIADGIATGGMQAKLNAAVDALHGAIAEVVIAPGAGARIIEALLSGIRTGTRLTASRAEVHADA
ncbi:MAG TPA: acetylglutamate kinase [Bryobacteraceae bacterium]|nr:acetylglutamate kinase [Bryobacteraceae bacterium]